MALEPEKLKAEVAKLKEQVAAKAKASKEPRKDPELRKARKTLKRAQRKLTRTVVVSPADQAAKAQKLIDHLSKMSDTLTKEHKKASGDPHVHSLRKKIRSLNRKIKRINRRAAKAAKPEAPKASS